MPCISTRWIFTSPVLPKEVQAGEQWTALWAISGWGGKTILYKPMCVYTDLLDFTGEIKTISIHWLTVGPGNMSLTLTAWLAEWWAKFTCIQHTQYFCFFSSNSGGLIVYGSYIPWKPHSLGESIRFNRHLSFNLDFWTWHIRFEYSICVYPSGFH